jgi:hypothetical protein
MRGPPGIADISYFLRPAFAGHRIKTVGIKRLSEGHLILEAEDKSMKEQNWGSGQHPNSAQ